MEGSIGVSTSLELGFFFPSVILKESGISDGVDIDMLRGSMSGLLIERVVMGGVSNMRKVEIF